MSTLAKRIIPCLDVKDGRVVKGTHFRDLRDAGDPVELGAHYSNMGADELMFLDISATVEERKTLAQLVARIAMEVNIPFAVGGGVGAVEDVETLLRAGADKVSIGSRAVTDPDLVEAAGRHFGAQCIVISIDAKRDRERGDWRVHIHGGATPTEVSAVPFARRMERAGAGELLINSLDRDGTRQGFDIELLERVAETVNIPVIASSGAGSAAHFAEVFERTGVTAALGATVFHYGEIQLRELKRELAERGLPIRVA